MDVLLAALRQKDEEAINLLACRLFITRAGKANRPQINEFEYYGPCRIHIYGKGESNKEPFGYITYRGNTFSFG